MSEYSISTTHQFYYNNKGHIPIPDLIDSLLGVEALMKRTPSMLEKLMPGVKIEKIDIHVNEITTGSITEDLIIDIVFGDEEAYNKCRESLRKLRKEGVKGMSGDEKKSLKPLIGLLFAGMIGAGAVYLAKSNNQPTTHIEAYNSTVVNFGAGEFGFDGDKFKEIIEAAGGGNKKKLAKDVVNIIKPAKNDDEASLIIDGNELLTIAPKLIKSVPSYYEEPERDEKSQDYTDVEIFIIANDRDSNTNGWAGSIANIVDKRTVLKIDDSIQAKKLHGRISFKADVTVHSRYNKNIKGFVPYEILIKKANI